MHINLTLCDISQEAVQSSYGGAFGLVFGAGFSTALGSALAFLPKASSPAFLSACLAISAGVMVYVSFLEIFRKARAAIEPCLGSALAHTVTFLSFFFGMALVIVLDKFVHFIFQLRRRRRAGGSSAAKASEVIGRDEEAHVEEKGGNISDNIFEIEPASIAALSHIASKEGDKVDNSKKSEKTSGDDLDVDMLSASVLSAVAIAIHNFPEGLATFIAAVADPTIGVTVAVAIIMHNIPEVGSVGCASISCP
uniref:Zinc transporter n=1 Tax=Palpitomonas bilix TaxID=652834 RepID=A0A7S3LVY7_9EUKA|mmetsp:Transcript_5413/g.12230  ORF Transcript_5413/g.12230 Transcript_5413/m.12230 type:complete len:252 (+) Transcript_5413:144-899(+)